MTMGAVVMENYCTLLGLYGTLQHHSRVHQIKPDQGERESGGGGCFPVDVKKGPF